MNNDEFKVLTNLLKFSKSIKDIYNVLYELEVKGLKESFEYVNNLERLDIATEIYNNYLEEIPIEKCMNILDYLRKEENKIDNGLIKNEIEKNESNIIFKKIKNSLMESIIYNSLSLNQKIHYYQDENSFNTRAEHEFIFKDDIIYSFVLFIEDAIKEKENRKFLSDLLKIKYEAPFLHQGIEKDLLHFRFFITDYIYYSSKLKFDLLYNLDDSVYYTAKNNFAFNMIVLEIIKLLNISDCDFLDKETILNSIKRHASLRTGLILLDDDYLERIEDLHDNYYENSNIQNNISQSMINAALNLRDKDKEKPMVLSLEKN